eukprot:6528051-Heterocapsa_arctica.AAC.1
MISRFAISIADETDGLTHEPAFSTLPQPDQPASPDTGATAVRDHGTGRDMGTAVRLSLCLAELIDGGA